MGRKKNQQFTGYSSGWYDYNEGCVNLSYWDDDKRRIESLPFQYYFFVDKDDLDSVIDREFESMIVDMVVDGDYYKIYSSVIKSDRYDLVDWLNEKGIISCEADLPPLSRYLVDNPVRFANDLKILFYDLETDGRSGWDNILEHRVLSVACYNKNGKYKVLVAERGKGGERKLLKEFISIIAEHDLLVAWNGDAYDEQVLKQRCKACGIYPNWRMVNFLDMLLMFKHPYFGYGRDTENKGVKLSFALDNIGNKLLGFGKTEKYNARQIYNMWKDEDKKLIKYNRRDVEIMVKLEEKFGYIDSLKVLSHMCNCFLSSWSLKMGYLNDAFTLRYGVERGVRFPTKFRAFYNNNPWVVQRNFEGAYVMDPEVGLHKNVVDVDFASLYPNIIRTFNISPETKVDQSSKVKKCKAANGVWFKNDEEGIFPGIVTQSMERRKGFKNRAIELEKNGEENSIEFRIAKQRSDACKLIGNGSYGCLGSPFLRHYDPDCAEAVTLTAQAIIKLVIKWAQKEGIQTIYSDTDSVFLKCTVKKAEKFIDLCSKKIDRWVRQNGGNPGFIRLEVDFEYKRIFFTTKKRYAGKKANGKHDIKGLEYVRTDDCGFCRKMQKDVVDYLLEDEKPDVSGVKKILDQWYDKLISGKFDIEDITITKSINKALDDYKSVPIHVRIARVMMEKGMEVFQGMKVPFIITDGGSGKNKKANGVHIDMFDGTYDKFLYWNKKIFPATKRILDAVFPTYDNLWNDILFRGQVKKPRKRKNGKTS